MRIFIAVLVLIFIFQSWIKAEEKIDQLFGVKIFDSIENYANKNNGEPSINRPGTIYFSNEVIKIERSSNFDSFYLRTDNQYKVINVTGFKTFVETHSSFRNICLKNKTIMVEKLSSFFDTSKDKFLSHFWHNQKYKSIWEESQLIYDDENNKLVLSVHCSYRKNNEDAIVQELGVSWVTYDYYEKHIKGLWKEINQFDNKFIKSFLVVAENI